MTKALKDLCLPSGILLAVAIFLFSLISFASRGQALEAAAQADLVRASAPTQALEQAQADLTAADARIIALTGELAALRQIHADALIVLQVQQIADVKRANEANLALQIARAGDLMHYAEAMSAMLANQQ